MATFEFRDSLPVLKDLQVRIVKQTEGRGIHTKRDSRRTGKLDHFFLCFFVNGKVIPFIDRHFGEDPVSGNGYGVNGQAGIDVVFSKR